jgi:predicted nucleic acid-binding Zn ribbon protein
MSKPIKDEFTKLKISRQRRYQLRMRRDKRCIICGTPITRGQMCLEHMIQARERQRKRLGLKRRHRNALTYRLQRKEA